MTTSNSITYNSITYKRSGRIITLSLISSLCLLGCGQKGNLYLPSDANANDVGFGTQFILYKPDATEAADDARLTEQSEPVMSETDVDAIMSNPDDY